MHHGNTCDANGKAIQWTTPPRYATRQHADITYIVLLKIYYYHMYVSNFKDNYNSANNQSSSVTINGFISAMNVNSASDIPVAMLL